MALTDDQHAACVVQRRPARRQPGADRANGRRAQAAAVPAAREDGLQGDRGRLPRGLADRLRFRQEADRRADDSRRRHRPGADPVARAADPPHVRRARGMPAGDRPSLQFDVDDAAPRRVRPRPPGHPRHRDQRCRDHPRLRRQTPGHRLGLPVLAGELHRHRARLRRRDLRCGQRRLAADAGAQGDHQPAGDRRNGAAQRLRRPDRVDVAAPRPPRLDRAVGPPAQRPRQRRRRRRACADGRRGAHRGLPVRQRRAHRQRLPRHARAQPVHAGHRPRHRLFGHQRDHPHVRALQPDGGPAAPPVWRRPGVHRVFRVAPGCDQEGARRPRDDDRARRAAVGRAVSADRPRRRRPDLRCRDPRQQPVGQGRHRVPARARLRARAAATCCRSSSGR